MKELNQYQCEICGMRYWDRSVAKKCEATHILPKTKGAVDGYIYYKEGEYPEYISIEFKDGTVGYYRKSYYGIHEIRS